MTSIGSYAFQDCVSISEINIPKGVTTIGASTFEGCTGLAEIVLPEGVTSIGSSAFSYCTNLVSIAIPSTVTSIGEYAFYNCSSLAFVDITDLAAWCNIDFIGEAANPLYKNGVVLYVDGKKAVNIVLPKGVKRVSDFAFVGYDSLNSVVIPEGTTSIGRSAFKDCTGLNSVTISSSITSIEEYAFKNCKNLNAVYISDLAAWCGISFGNDSANPIGLVYYNNALLYVNGNPTTDIVIPDGVTKINTWAFYGYQNMTSITIPATVMEIDRYAFDGLTSKSKFKAVYISDLTAWSKIKFADSSYNPLSSAHNLYLNGVLFDQLPIPEGTTALASPYTFSGADCITSVCIPKSLKTIGQNVFLNCDNVTDIYYAGTADEWERVRIGANNGSLSTAKIHYGSVWDTVKVAFRSSADGTVTGMPSGTSTRGDYTIPNNVPKRPGYTFLGWSTTPDGEVEYEPGSVFKENTYVTFYAVWEKAPYLLGDIDGNDTVDLDDAILLFQHSMLPELYPISYAGNVDFNKDGTVDIDDAVLLFQYSMLPDLYPLE